ncbi:MAG: GH1 family beta-glucosidase, partial [Candidatus Limnocylindrales bacterium]
LGHSETGGFPAGFRWGVATSAYQVEGAWDEDGRGPSVWDAFVRRPYRVVDGSTGDVACDHYHRMPEDVDLMRSLGIGAYRFSIAWPRVIPSGRGPINRPGLDFYDRLVDQLRAAGIAPYATLNHWDLPIDLERTGGWTDRATVDAFVEYAGVLFDRLGDRVAGWVTHNEPGCQAFLGHGTGLHAPGRCDMSAAYQVVHHLLLSHGRAVQAFRASGAVGPIGIALNPQWYVAASDDPADHAARRRVWANAVDLFLDPIVHGRYPSDLTDWIDQHRPAVAPGDLETIHQPIDFVGLNYYTAERIRWDVEGSLLKAGSEPYSEPGWGQTTMGWGIAPAGLTAVLLEIHDRYPDLPIVMTENGCAIDDQPDSDGHIDDQDRINYLREHIRALATAMDRGVDVRGYFAWTLFDNFEWSWGYTKRFGLCAIEPGTGRRILKASAGWYGAVARANGLAPG